MTNTDRIRTALADRYKIEREIGSGGMATVYLAEDLKHHRKVAVKVLRPDLAATLGAERFLREIEVAAQLTHPHILPLHDSGEADGFLFYVMPYIAGESLRERLEHQGELPIGEAVRIIRDVVDALASAHRHSVVHRDIKPDNVLLTEGHAVVTDFGVAKAVSEATGRQQITTAGVALGTPAYMAPEQASADPHLDHRVDIYAVGAMAYELLTGSPPFAGSSAQQILAAHITQAPMPVTETRGTVPPALGQFVMRCLEKKPADRWQTTDEMLPHLDALVTPSGGLTPTAARPFTATATRRRRRSMTVGLVGAAIVAATLGGISLFRGGASELVRDRVVVLPFGNRTGIDSLDVLADMAAYWLTQGLHSVPDLDVVPADLAIQAVQSLSAAEPGTRGDLVEAVARELRAGVVISGTTFLRGDSLLLQAEITDASTRRLLASIDGSGGIADVSDALETLRERAMGALALRLDERMSLLAFPSTPPRYAAYREYREGQTHHGRLEYGPALERYARAFELDSTFLDPLVLALVSLNNLRAYRRLDSVWQVLEPRRAELNEYNRLYANAMYSVSQGDNERALGLMREQARLAPATTATSNAGWMALNTNRPEEAVRWMESADPTRVPLKGWQGYWSVLAAAHHRLGQHELELEVTTRARPLHPDNALWGMDISARALAAVGALAELDALLDTASGQPRAAGWTPGAVLWNAAKELRAHGYASEAQRVFQRAIAWYESTPLDAAWLRRQWAFLLLDAGRAGEAGPLFDQLSAESPGNVNYLGARGVVEASAGRLDAAKAISDSLEAVTIPFLRGLNTVWRARIAAVSGELDLAVRLLRQAFDEGTFHDYVWVHRDTGLEALWAYPPFVELTRPRG